MASFWPILVRLYTYVGPVVMLAYPLYASIIAIESPSKVDETQWLTYWVLYSLIQLLELGLSRVLYWIPFWYTLKLVLVSWLVLPQFHGAAFVYDNYVKKYMGGVAPGRGGKLTPTERERIEQMSPHARASIAAFITEFGSGAFDTLMQTASTEAAKHRPSKQE